jgi:hypothetical protein
MVATVLQSTRRRELVCCPASSAFTQNHCAPSVSVHGIVRSSKIANFVEFNVDMTHMVILNSSAVTVL